MSEMTVRPGNIWSSASFPSPEAMALGLLWLSLALLGALQIQAEVSTPHLIPLPSMRRIPVQPRFQNKQFQGKWYVLGLAGNEFNEANHSQFKIYANTYKLNEDNSYNITSTFAWNDTCANWVRTFNPTARRAQYSLANIERYTGIQKYFFLVVATDYKQFAMLFFKKFFRNQKYFKVVLYGRSKEVSPEVKEEFISFAKFLDLTDQHIIFPIPNGNPQLGRGEG
ncbi:neutrophil gelatinase-associated lipocalin-like [Suricata suricatta]|uniref:neutrophil gelatinase-associated lipocalin-like n=1 Tax=Suricata suricatta TaxID=37032 RepID=UPI0011557A9D|nr:neutrophil gelatinase-associated lipocalin-like [Suricata suricatta]